jgi:hypothetical protein
VLELFSRGGGRLLVLCVVVRVRGECVFEGIDDVIRSLLKSWCWLC